MSALPEPGEELGGFRVEERVYVGGMAALFRVTRAGSDLPMLMKVPLLGRGQTSSTVISFEVEQTILATLRGRHVPQFVASGDQARVPYIVMERIDGPSLESWVARGRIAPEEVARLGAAVASAVHDLHLQDVIHLDLKPGNVLFRPSGEAVLVDFGLAHHARYPDLIAEEIRLPAGSAGYVAPEQILGVRSDPRSDVFALGVILYELATGTLPFGAPTSPGGLRSRIHAEPEPPRAIIPDLPPALQEVILRCLEPRPEDRYPTAAQVALDLSNLDQVPVTPRGQRLRRAGLGARARRWLRGATYDPSPERLPSTQLARGRIVLVAMSPVLGDEERAEALRAAAAPLVADAGTRLACLTVVPPAPDVAEDPGRTATGQRIRHRIALRNWAEPMRLPPERISFHVIEASDAAAAILAHARANRVDHILLGAPPPRAPLSGMLAGLTESLPAQAIPEPVRLARIAWTVASRVVADAPCSVTVVRTRGVA